MRIYITLLAATALTACESSGPQTVGSSAVTPTTTSSTPVSGGTGGGVTTGATPTPTPTPTPAPTPTPTTTGGTTGGTSTTTTGGTGGGVTGGTPTNTTTTAGFLTLTAAKTFNAVGALQSLTKLGNSALYQGNASTVRTPSGTVSYDPRDGIFTLILTDTKAGINSTTRFQDPAHRTDFNGNSTPGESLPNLSGFNYVQAVGASPDDLYTMFYQRPGVSTNYVSLAGYARDKVPVDPAAQRTYERGAFVFGDQTLNSNIPATGTGTYSGGYVASMVNNPSYDTNSPKLTYYQWMYGTSNVAVDFGKATVGVSLSGVVDKAYNNGVEILNIAIPGGSTFSAVGSGTIDLVHTSGFTGQFATASFGVGNTTVPVSFSSINTGTNVAGASSIDGTFFGPGAVNVGGNFRIVGGVPDQRIDIQGAFTGARVGP